MVVAWLLTLLAISGVWVGVSIGRNTARLSNHLAAAGGGLLFGIAIFWLVPEIGQTSSRIAATLLVVGVAGALAFFDWLLAHTTYSVRHGVMWPLLVATAVHGILDGWSVRLLTVQPLDSIAVGVALALHKVPEGVAVGWVARRATGSPWRAFLAAAAAELFTMVGAISEPALNASGSAHFGSWWTTSVLSVIAGGFLFLAVHAILPGWRRLDVMAVFLATLLLLGALTFVRAGAV